MPFDITKPALILDLDQTLISAESTDDFIYEDYEDRNKIIEHVNMDDYYIVYSRPNLQKFLDYVFENFNVTIWTAASKDYALFIIDKIIIQNKPERTLDFIFFSYHCDLSRRTKKYSKELCMLWDIHKLPGYTSNNTVIMDDYIEDVHKSQPNNCIIVPPYEFLKDKSDDDTFLIDIIPQLDKMRKRIKEGKTNLTQDINIDMKTINN